MKSCCILCLLLLTGYLVTAQNLVPNPGFEDMDTCPTDPGQIRCPLNPSAYPVQSVSNWISGVNDSSPDYYNGCSPSNYVTVPNNFFGYHPANNGRGYAGIVAFSSVISDPPFYFAEYTEVMLLAPLQADSFYEISCYVKPVLVDNPISIATMAVNALGAALSDTTLLGYTTPLDATPVKLVAQGSAFLNDTTGWVKVTGHYKAKGGERWLTLGGHFTGFRPTLTHLHPKPPVAYTHYHSYYFIDDVSVSNHPPCDTFITVHDTVICNTDGTPATLSSTAPQGSYYNWNTGDTSRYINIVNDSTYVCLAIHGCHLYIDSFRAHVGFDTLQAKPYRSFFFCEGGEYTISPFQEGESYKWSTGENTRSIVVKKQGVYTCYIKAGCIIFKEEYNGFVYQGVNNLQPIGDTTICKELPLTIGRNYDFDVKYSWNTGDTICCISPVNSGLYTVTISTEHCGSITDSAQVVLKDCYNCIWVPDAFTPNKDGLNDYFGVVPSCDINSFELLIYNRWGQEVFSATDIQTRWNGMYGADFAEMGTYYYYITYRTPYRNETQKLKGNITLIR